MEGSIMSVLDDVKQVLHRMRVKLYPSNLPGREGKWIARTENERTLTYQEVCKLAKERGGFSGNLDDLTEHSAVFLREAVYQVCDGFGVNFGGLFTMYPNVSGEFDDEHSPVDKEKNKLTVHVRILDALRRAIEGIQVENLGAADTGGKIFSLKDITTDSVNDVVTKGGMFALSGQQIKVLGDSPKVGVSFIRPGSPDLRVAVQGNLAENEPSKIIGIVPELPPGDEFFVEVRTFYAHGKQSKEMSSIRSEFTVKIPK
jgi:hypothetical protein